MRSALRAYIALMTASPKFCFESSNVVSLLRIRKRQIPNAAIVVCYDLLSGSSTLLVCDLDSKYSWPCSPRSTCLPWHCIRGDPSMHVEVHERHEPFTLRSQISVSLTKMDSEQLVFALIPFCVLG